MGFKKKVGRILDGLTVKQKTIIGFGALTILYPLIVGNFFLSIVVTWPFWQQFFFVTVPIFLFPSIVLGQFFRERYMHIIGSFLFLISIDIIIPPYLVNFDGTFGSVTLGYASSDLFVASLFTGFVGGPLLYVVTYIVAPVALLGFAAYLLTNKQLKDLLD